MATTAEDKTPAAPKAQRDRSPAYPFIPLKTALDRVAAFDLKFGRHGSPLDKAGLAWGYKGDSSQAAQTLSALKYFGLVEYAGPTNERVVNLTNDARNYMRAQQASAKAEIIKACALRPKAMQTYWNRWGSDRPIDEVCLDQLILKDSFTEVAAKVFLRVYDETIAFASLELDDKIDAIESRDEGELPPPPAPPAAPTPKTDPQHRQPARDVANAPDSRAIPPKGAGMRQEVFALAEGDVTIQWPERLSPESLQDFNDWMVILQRKIKRSVLPSTPNDLTTPQDKDE